MSLGDQLFAEGLRVGIQREISDHRKLRRIAIRAIAEGWGKILSPGQVKLDDPACDDPCRFTLYNRGARELVTGRRIRPLEVHGAGRCRRCEPCREQRSRMWTARAIDECNRWDRTVFGTFTLSPENHVLMANRARRRLWPEKDFDGLEPSKQFEERAREVGAEVSKWLDRVRHGRDGHTSTPIRYLLVAEAHDSERTSVEMRGLPHFHMLLHDVSGTAIKGSPSAALLDGQKLSCDVEAGEWERRNVPDGKGGWRPAVFVRDEAFIRKNWTLGFTKWQWAEDARAAYYVCKYVSKSILGVRVRASRKYGRLGNSSGISRTDISDDLLKAPLVTSPEV